MQSNFLKASRVYSSEGAHCPYGLCYLHLSSMTISCESHHIADMKVLEIIWSCLLLLLYIVDITCVLASNVVCSSQACWHGVLTTSWLRLLRVRWNSLRGCGVRCRRWRPSVGLTNMRGRRGVRHASLRASCGIRSTRRTYEVMWFYAKMRFLIHPCMLR